MNKEKKRYHEITTLFLQRFAGEKKGENVVFSPLSTIVLMAMLADGAAGETREEIISFLGEDLTPETLKELQEELGKDGSLISSNAVCVQQHVREDIREEYEKRLQELFEGELFSSEHFVQDVNAWVRKRTKGMIDKIADDSMQRMLLCLLNAVCFEAEWDEPYRKRDIRRDWFRNGDGTERKVPMMSSKERTYLETDVFTGFEKPYEDGEYTYLALLPKEVGDEALTAALRELDLGKIRASAQYTEVLARMPEFRMDFAKDLTTLCKDLGMSTAFTTEADFSPMAKTDLMVNSILHKAHIEVDRKGTKAAAVTAGMMELGALPSMGEPKEVILDRPFVYAVVHWRTGLPIFAGVVEHL